MSCWNSFYWHLSQFSTVSFHNHFKLYSQTKLFIFCTVEAVDLHMYIINFFRLIIRGSCFQMFYEKIIIAYEFLRIFC